MCGTYVWITVSNMKDFYCEARDTNRSCSCLTALYGPTMVLLAPAPTMMTCLFATIEWSVKLEAWSTLSNKAKGIKIGRVEGFL